ncbi:MAG: TIGR01841 family phasin [Beijerinckiaceae bacterium]
MIDDVRKSLEDMIKKFGSDLDLPKVDIDKLIETHQKNIDALVRSAKAANDGVQAVAVKQRETLEAAMNDAITMAKSLKPGADPKELLTQQREAVERVVDSAISSTKSIAMQVQTLNSEVFKIVVDRLAGSASEIRASFKVAPKEGPKD